MPRFRPKQRAHITLDVEVTGTRDPNGVLSVDISNPSKWGDLDGHGRQHLLVYEGNLVRPKKRLRIQGCQVCVKDSLRQLADRGTALAGMTIYINIQSRKDCISGHGDFYTDDDHVPPKRDPDDADTPLDPNAKDEEQ